MWGAVDESRMVSWNGNGVMTKQALIDAPLIPAGFRWFLRNPVECGGIKFGRDTSQNDIPGDEYSSGMMSFQISRQNGQKEMVPECNNQNTDY